MGPFVFSNVASWLNRLLSRTNRNVHCLRTSYNDNNDINDIMNIPIFWKKKKKGNKIMNDIVFSFLVFLGSADKLQILSLRRGVERDIDRHIRLLVTRILIETLLFIRFILMQRNTRTMSTATIESLLSWVSAVQRDITILKHTYILYTCPYNLVSQGTKRP